MKVVNYFVIKILFTAYFGIQYTVTIYTVFIYTTVTYHKCSNYSATKINNPQFGLAIVNGVEKISFEHCGWRLPSLF